METAPLKSFATWARTALIREVTARIAVVLASASPDRVEQPNAVAALEKAVNAAGDGEAGRVALADKVAYTWFNRIIALRFMDANGYTGIGVVSPERGRDGGQPEVLAEAKRGNIDSAVVTQTRTVEAVTSLLNGARRSDDPQGEAYALLLAEYCRHWNRAMPFMFEREGDFTELLIPANLLADDSVLARAVTVLTEDVCQDVEVIGWLYQFYISERKDEVFAGFKKNQKAGAAEIPAATQLFTPHWIVRYLVENSLGRLWLLNRPTSRLAEQLDYYIAPVDEQTDFLKVASPEELKIIDPACGSGHMLTYAFDLLYVIYEEEGYAPADIPGLVLANNLYGTEIDPRAGSLAAFALTMKARARQRTFFNNQVEPNICVLEPIWFSPSELRTLVTPDGDRADEEGFWNQFQHADTFGALIRPRDDLIGRLRRNLDASISGDDLLGQDLIVRAGRAALQAEYLSPRYSIVVTNPPYMGSGNMGARLSAWVKDNFSDEKQDLYGCFVSRGSLLACDGGLVAMIVGDTWMTIKTFEAFRKRLLDKHTFLCFLHLRDTAYHADTFGANAAFVVSKRVASQHKSTYINLEALGAEAKRAKLLEVIRSPGASGRFTAAAEDFMAIPGSPIVFWADKRDIEILASGPRVADYVQTREGLTTGDNSRFLRRWHEVSNSRIAWRAGGDEEVSGRWFLYIKGGEVRRWFGNLDYVVDWEHDGRRQLANVDPETGRVRSHNYNGDYAFREGLTWSGLSSSQFSARYVPGGFMFDATGPMGFACKSERLLPLIGLLNSSSTGRFMRMMSPTLHFKIGHVLSLPVRLDDSGFELLGAEVAEAIERGRTVWNLEETSFGFTELIPSTSGLCVREWVSDRSDYRAAIAQHLQDTDRRIDDIVDGSLGYEPDTDSLPPDLTYLVDDSDVLAEVRALVFYAVGCMFGRYSLDEAGLILANQGDTLQKYLAKIPKPTFMPDSDNVIPIVDGDWFEDDVVARFRQFVRVAFGEQNFEENLRFVAESLGVKDLRDYFVKSFYKDHVQRYKKRPIYWLFSSPKASFNALIYMHRYTPSTVSTVLNEYLREFKGKLEASRQHHERLAAGGGAPRQLAAAQKEVDRLRKVLLELDEYEHDVLYPLATQQVEIDLDDGVKANYPKFGAALKKIPGLEANDE